MGSRFAPLSPAFQTDRWHHGTAPHGTVAPIHALCRSGRLRSLDGLVSARDVPATVKWTYFYLYVILDVFSRYVVGWMVALREGAGLASKLIEETCQKQIILPGQLTIHADRGSSMRGKPMALLLADLSITKTHSRPYTSNDNPYSESQFRTMKYSPAFPERFGCIQDSRAFCQPFFAWYNDDHRHSGIGMMTPAMVHYGQAPLIRDKRQTVLDAAYLAHPGRFVRRSPVPRQLPKEVWINKPQNSDN